MQDYDIIIAGGGAAGLSLAYRLSLSELSGKKILIIDKEQKDKNDRTWGYWSTDEQAFDHLAKTKFQAMDFRSQYLERRFSLGNYSYRILRGIDFYTFVKNHLSTFANISFVHDAVIGIQDLNDAALVKTSKNSFRAHWVFSSIFREEDIRNTITSELYLKQHFKGYLIRTAKAYFDTEAFTMFDFRTAQKGVMRFFYVIPFEKNKALVEYTLFSENLLAEQEYDEAIQEYLHQVLKIDDYQILETEKGIIPMTNFIFPVSQGGHIIHIGSAGGSSKPSSGYTFTRIQRHVAKIVEALEKGRSPAISANSALPYRFYDSVLLNILKNRGGLAENIFSQLFKRNSIRQVFQFLDEQGGLPNDLKIIISLPPFPFLRSTIGLLFK